MFLVERDRVGSVAFARLAAERLIHEVIGDRALPADMQSTRALRAHLIAPFAPHHAWLTGLAALWLEGWCPAPSGIDLAGPRGLHRTVPVEGSPPLIFHGGHLLGLPKEPHVQRLATPTRACLDALAHSPAGLAIPATASAICAGATSVRNLEAMLAGIDPRTAYRTRVASLVAALGTLDALAASDPACVIDAVDAANCRKDRAKV